MNRILRWFVRRDLEIAYEAGYRAAVDKILLLPEKVRLGNTLDASDRDVSGCSFVGGSPAVLMQGDHQRVQNVHMEHCELGIRIDPGTHHIDQPITLS